MLFDLRGRGRRKTVQVIYLTLAILMGGGLVLFGIGGATSGGLIDAFQGGGGGGNDVPKQNAEKAREAVQARPRDAVAWAKLAQAELQLAPRDVNGNFTPEAADELRAADRAWQRHLALDPAKVDDAVAAQMVNAYAAGLNDPKKAVDAQEIVVNAREPSSGQFAVLAQLAYAAGQTRKGDLAAKRALELAPKDQRAQLKSALDDAKTSAAGGGASTSQGAAASG